MIPTVRTTAGRRLLANEAMNARSFALITPEAIAAIEAEAAAAERARLTEAVGGLREEEWRDCFGDCHGATVAAVLALLEPEA